MSLAIQASVALALAISALVAAPAAFHASASEDTHMSAPIAASVDSGSSSALDIRGQNQDQDEDQDHDVDEASASLGEQGNAQLTDDVSLGL